MALLTKDYTTQTNRRILVIDQAISEEMGQHLYEYVNQHIIWAFDANEQNNGDNVQFIHTLDNDLIKSSPLWQHLQRYINKFYGPGYIPYNCSINHTRFGDNPMDHRDTYDESAKDVSLLLYLNPYWNKNFSGETVYFDEQGEIELSVLPKFCRLAMHEGYVNHASRAPSRLLKKSRYTLAIKATPDTKYRIQRLADDEQSADDEPHHTTAHLENYIFGQTRTSDEHTAC